MLVTIVVLSMLWVVVLVDLLVAAACGAGRAVFGSVKGSRLLLCLSCFYAVKGSRLPF